MDLLQNGLHSLKKAINNLKDVDGTSGDERELIVKEVILGIHHSTETLFKYLVKNKHDILIYQDLKDYFSKEVNRIKGEGTTDFKVKTITFMEAINRAIVLNESDIEISKVDYDSFERLNSLRNSITHHECNLAGKEVDFLITQVLTIIFPIYKKLIPNFEEYIIKHNLNINGTKQVNNYRIWRFLRHFSLRKKFFESEELISSIRSSNETYVKKLKQIKKEEYIKYHECPSCNQPYFQKEQIFFEAAEEVGYYGHCLLCKLSLNKEDAQYIHMTYRSYSAFLESTLAEKTIIQDLLNDEGLVECLNKDDLSVIHKITSHPKTNYIVEFYAQDFMQYFIGEILEYYVRELNYDAYALDQAAVVDYILKDSHTVDRLQEDDLEELKKKIENCRAININLEIFEKVIEEEFIFYSNTYHPNPHTDEDDEISIELTVKLGDKRFLNE
ncbi:MULTISPECIES: hypothetical protein [Bacillus cereus group]|uniref:hypothetical protein n=1 Tax=Bacillus cereus group TaxID=86661 RepID=UPI0011A72456|nr:hypothetical protein [Bacillus tropicus]